MISTAVGVPKIPVIAAGRTLVGGGPVTATALALPAIVIGENFSQPRYTEFIRLKTIVEAYVPEEP